MENKNERTVSEQLVDVTVFADNSSCATDQRACSLVKVIKICIMHTFLYRDEINAHKIPCYVLLSV